MAPFSPILAPQRFWVVFWVFFPGALAGFGVCFVVFFLVPELVLGCVLGFFLVPSKEKQSHGMVGCVGRCGTHGTRPSHFCFLLFHSIP